MKQITILVLFSFYSLVVSSQKTSSINIGFGYPGFFQANFDKNSGGSHTINSGRIHVFTEIRQLIRFKNNPAFLVTPGIGYFLFNESESSGALGGGSSTILKHYAVSLYAKLNYSITKDNEKPFCWYAGVLGGFYVFSKTKGEMYWWMYQQGGSRSGIEEIDKSGKSFYNNFYNGIYAGFKIKTGKNDFFRPAFEFSFFPGYANITDKFLSDTNKDEPIAKSMGMISLTLGFGKKKATQVNE
ncbi:MAG: hypothetical protein FD181_1514 [Prolixibacteraceae bacterium]|nr:MAG: hypothetical protein FD181_1514 [Prolixibacteraceae bacterium]